MRPSAISRLAISGADLKTIQELSGHESLQMVLRYAHPQDKAIDDALDSLEEAASEAVRNKAIHITPKLHQTYVAAGDCAKDLAITN